MATTGRGGDGGDGKLLQADLGVESHDGGRRDRRHLQVLPTNSAASASHKRADNIARARELLNSPVPGRRSAPGLRLHLAMPRYRPTAPPTRSSTRHDDNRQPPLPAIAFGRDGPKLHLSDCSSFFTGSGSATADIAGIRYLQPTHAPALVVADRYHQSVRPMRNNPFNSRA